MAGEVEAALAAIKNGRPVAICRDRTGTGASLPTFVQAAQFASPGALATLDRLSGSPTLLVLTQGRVQAIGLAPHLGKTRLSSGRWRLGGSFSRSGEACNGGARFATVMAAALDAPRPGAELKRTQNGTQIIQALDSEDALSFDMPELALWLTRAAGVIQAAIMSELGTGRTPSIAAAEIAQLDSKMVQTWLSARVLRRIHGPRITASVPSDALNAVSSSRAQELSDACLCQWSSS